MANSAVAYILRASREKRRERIDAAMAEAWRVAARMTRASLQRAIAARLDAYRTKQPTMETFYRNQITELRHVRAALLDVRRYAREVVDGN